MNIKGIIAAQNNHFDNQLNGLQALGELTLLMTEEDRNIVMEWMTTQKNQISKSIREIGTQLVRNED